MLQQNPNYHHRSLEIYGHQRESAAIATEHQLLQSIVTDIALTTET